MSIDQHKTWQLTIQHFTIINFVFRTRTKVH